MSPFVVLTAVWALVLSACATVDQPNAQQPANVNDALRYLREIDRYYAQVARPSTRSEAVNMNNGDEDLFKAKQALRMLRLQELDKIYTQRSRPRFGKRTQPQLQTEKHNLAGVWGDGGVTLEEESR